MITENLSTLKIHKLTQEQYDRELEAGRIDETALYLTPDEEIDLSGYATVDDLNGKADEVHAHDDLYYTEAEIDDKLNTVNTSITNIINGDVVVKEAEHSGSADEAGHATNADEASKLTNARTISLSGDATGSVSFDGTQDVEITVTVADDLHNHVIDNIDGLQTALDGKAAEGHNHDDVYDAYGAAEAVKNELLNGAGEAYDTLKELGDLINENVDAIDALEQIATGKADANHNHDDSYYTETEIEEKISIINTSINAKVNTADIVDNLTTENASLPLSAKQGVLLQSKITEVENAIQENTDAIAGITEIPDADIIALFYS